MNGIKLMGGLGNQIFQYAFGMAFESRETSVYFENSWFLGKRTRLYRLNYFNTNVRFGLFKNKELFKENNTYHPNILEKQHTDFFGYWQFYPYYKDILDELRYDFVLDPKYTTDEFQRLLVEINESESVAVHVRRGDYLKQTGWGVLPITYYFHALKETSGNLFIFSDDLDYCKGIFKHAFFPGRKIKFVQLEDYLDFTLMKNCKTNVIANSTFSYWAALLNGKQNKKVICPSHWLGESNPDTIEMHYPSDWIKIENY